jgi:predicted nucleic acid-binding protein
MKRFFDTSVLVAAFWRGHPSHDSSLDLVSRAERRKAACSLHALAELYATMTALPVREAIQPEQALLFVQQVRDRLTLVSLDEGEYFAAIYRAAERGFASGRIYDALILECASKFKADAVYTWNLKHFRSIAPELALKIQTP